MTAEEPQHEPLIRNSIVFIMEQSDEIVGFAALDTVAGEVRALYVAPEAVRCGTACAGDHLRLAIVDLPDTMGQWPSMPSGK